MHKYERRVSDVMRPYWEAKAELNLPQEVEVKLKQLETNLHARILSLAFDADRELVDLARAVKESEASRELALELARKVSEI